MENNILKIVKDFAKNLNLRVLFVSIGGSRHFGWHSKSSDYDVYVVFCRSWRRYASIQTYKETYEASYQQNPPISVVFYDLKKVLKMLRASNKRIIEMFSYRAIKDFPELQYLAVRSIRAKPMLFGYYSAASETVHKLVNHPKRYFPTIYGILIMAKFLYEFEPLTPQETSESTGLNASQSISIDRIEPRTDSQTELNDSQTELNTEIKMPEIDPELSLVELLPYAPTHIAPIIMDLLAQKKNEEALTPNPHLDEWIKESLPLLLDFIKQMPAEKTPSADHYDRLLWSVLAS